jgi:hypothetical protein
MLQCSDSEYDERAFNGVSSIRCGVTTNSETPADTQLAVLFEQAEVFLHFLKLTLAQTKQRLSTV